MKYRIAVLFLLLASRGFGAATSQASDYRGLKAVTLSNATARVVIVPAAGRIMSFQLCDAKSGTCSENPIWNNPQLGAGLKPDGEGWTNYGGDKSWPAPQSDWGKITGRGWPPPLGFDHMPFTAEASGGTVTLTSPVDPAYGIRVKRVITLDSEKPVLRVATTYEKVSGAVVTVSVWTITQMNSPERMFIRLPEKSSVSGGYIKTPRNGPNDPYAFEAGQVKIEGRLLSLTRDRKTKRKLGSDGDELLWLGKELSLRISQEPALGKPLPYPDGGAHTELYTNPDENPYVEFEELAPLHAMKPGDAATLTVTYTLARRESQDDSSEAKRLFEAK